MFKNLLSKLARVMTKTTGSPAKDSALNHVQKTGIEKAKDVLAADGKIPTEKKPRVKMGKYAMILGYQGKNYFGMQVQKGLPTIESCLLDAMHKAGWITEEQKETPFSFYFQRAARTDKAVSAARQVCGMQLPKNDDYYKIEGVSQLNNYLPEDIRVFGIRRATAFFHPQKLCDYRTYSYTTPTFVFAKPNELTNSSFRITQERIDEVNDLLSIFLGTHNFYNYTSKKSFNDMSCNRYIVSFKCGEPFLFRDQLRNEDVEFVSLVVKGQSFVLHQIRKMIGMVITVVRELQLKSTIQRTFEGQRMDVPMAPGLGLLLERAHFDSYDNKHKNTHESLSHWGDTIEENIEKTKYKLITVEMLEAELRTQGMLKWLANLVHHDFIANPEQEEPESKSFLTMAAGMAQKSVKEKSDESMDGEKKVDEKEAEVEISSEVQHSSNVEEQEEKQKAVV